MSDLVDDAERVLDERGIDRAHVAGNSAARLGRSLPMPLLLRSTSVCRIVLRDIAEHGDRLGAEETAETTNDLLACGVADDMLSMREEIAPLDPLSCPITLAWSGADRLLPVEVNGAILRQRLVFLSRPDALDRPLPPPLQHRRHALRRQWA